MYGEMGKASNTMLFSDRPADVNALIAQARFCLFVRGCERDSCAPIAARSLKERQNEFFIFLFFSP